MNNHETQRSANLTLLPGQNPVERRLVATQHGRAAAPQCDADSKDWDRLANVLRRSGGGLSRSRRG